MAKGTLRDAGRCPNCDALLQYMADCRRCQEKGESCCYHSDNLNGECTAHCCKNGKLGPFYHTIGIEYYYDSPERYDGVSEWLCPFCNYREGRWTGKKLEDNQIESRFGQRGVITIDREN